MCTTRCTIAAIGVCLEKQQEAVVVVVELELAVIITENSITRHITTGAIGDISNSTGRLRLSTGAMPWRFS